MSNVSATAMSPSAARDLTESIRTCIDRAWELVVKAYTQRAWAVLGYTSWDTYCEREFGSTWFRLPRETRTEVVQSLRDAGLSTRAIAAATGVSPATVHRSITPGVSNGTPAAVTGTDGKTYAAAQPARPHLSVVPDLPVTPVQPEPAPMSQGGTGSGPFAPSLRISGDGYIVQSNAPAVQGVEPQITSMAMCPCGARAVLYDNATDDDRQRFDEFDDVHRYCDELLEPAAEPEPAPAQARRKPLTDSFDDATLALAKAVKRLEALTSDDRFDKYADQIAGLRLSDLVRARDAVQRVIEKFPSTPNQGDAS
ncbi:Uncharacterised protein [Mycobacteroides abscessus subsp. massiliense]|uniref:winged helix-turn-helix domain-containing protein n=1 Tax=Mycobacteroides abscessus TaxID=36809 RepID=UPI0009A57992|nr:winged helix-turn-helix domain-containing protein [Mycobacteroides abscessus]SKM82675.1 Uncharacterised protein [Mycobacteroides abscessus subsp. massiliense]SKM99386.1 Uncharacterised protein [Mycobacteroides abscessus subsp. massiliense]SKN77949.1 Uncharacterised protein [Mycobacteroides abscessus subsp. massiliense]SKN95293.1 Uncharacterised protein [Mycobacteroides abscessus subsp. massiliense]SKO23160.1 Uncharacterised protein [Mycobacteroides abscessus subsp. massiliense]